MHFERGFAFSRVQFVCSILIDVAHETVKSWSSLFSQFEVYECLCVRAYAAAEKFAIKFPFKMEGKRR